ncbi:MAG TPA: GntR family transcriptional regulator [Ktedonobacteraceae bacterium]|nr:GntR family transcriptional regulator [Ktedonobacteraceae bacterium]
MSAIYRNSPLPRYYQLKEILRERIRSGEWKPGSLIPSERELSEKYGISRMTARQAITDLVNEGIFYREQGKGTFVSNRKITQQLIHLTGFTEDIRARGQLPSTKVLTAEMAPADETTAEKLRIEPGTLIFRLQRLRLADDEPLAIEVSQIHFKGCERLLEEDLETNSLYRVLEARFGIMLMEADQELEAGLVENDEAQLLKISPGSPVLFTRRTTYTERNQPIEYAKAMYCGHKYTFYTHMKREQLLP